MSGAASPHAAFAGGGGAAAAGRRERTKAENRAAILDAGRRAFAELGYGATTVRDIVRRTELAAGTFYNYFPDKESVLRAIVDERTLAARARIRSARRGADTLERFVADSYREYFSSIADDPQLFALMRRNAGTVRALFDEPALVAGVEELREDLEAAAAAGLVPALDADYLAGAIAGVGFEVGLRMVEREPPDVEGATRFAAALFLGGLERLAAGAPAGSASHGRTGQPRTGAARRAPIPGAS